MLPKKLLCSQNVLVVTVMPLKMSSFFCEVHMVSAFEFLLGMGSLLLLHILALYGVCKHNYMYNLALSTV